MSAPAIFEKIVLAIKEGKMISRESKQDKEFHFQNWFQSRLTDSGLHFEAEGRNSYPDFRLVETTEGYEVKGLAYPGREVNYDCNSQVPSGRYNGRDIFYVFGRYPAAPDGNTYPVLDIVVCDGNFLNADHDYVHKNKSVKGFGSYGDIMIRDRKMYVAPTPFGLTLGTAHQQTLIVAEKTKVPEHFIKVGSLVRKEAERVVVGYSFDLRTNELSSETIPNPRAGVEHRFTAWRLPGCNTEAVSMRSVEAVVAEVEQVAETEDEEK